MNSVVKVLLVVVVIIALITIPIGLRVCSRTTSVMVEETDPRVLLDRYMWFKDASSQLDKKLADIKIYTSRVDTLRITYGEPKEWPSDIRSQYAIWNSEVAGIKASYNTLAAEYNAAMAKINWRFTNRGTLPEGASKPLPREYRVYVED